MSIAMRMHLERAEDIGKINKRWISYPNVTIEDRLDRLQVAKNCLSAFLDQATKLRDNKLKSTCRRNKTYK